jgi:hypothetical protein
VIDRRVSENIFIIHQANLFSLYFRIRSLKIFSSFIKPIYSVCISGLDRQCSNSLRTGKFALTSREIMGVVSVKAARMDGTGRAYLTQPVAMLDRWCHVP